jgi:hypothetical protein
VIQQSTRRIAILLAVSDVGATLAALAAAYFLRFRAEIVPVTKGIPDASSYYRLFPLMAALWPVVYYFYGLYQVRRPRRSHTFVNPTLRSCQNRWSCSTVMSCISQPNET